MSFGKLRSVLCLLIFFVLSGFAVVFAESGDDSSSVDLGDILVKGEAISTQSIPGTVNVIKEGDIEKQIIQRTDELLEQVPGIEIINYNQGGVANAIMMRGFRSGAHGGDIAIYVDGIPLNEGESHADGYADMNVIIPLELEKVEVYKGPISPLFGNFARAGAISFITKKGGEYKKIKANYGSFDTLDVESALGFKILDSIQTNMAFQFYKTDGYQDNSEWIKGNFVSRFGYKFSDKLDAGLSLRFHASDWNAPGYLPEYQFLDREASKHQAVNAENDGGNKEFYSQRIDLGYNLKDNVRLLYWVYATQQDFTRFAKFGYDPGGQTERNYFRHVYGTGGSLNFESLLKSYPVTGVIGSEFYYENTDWKRWDTSNRVRITQTQDRTFIIKTFSVFAQANLKISRYFRPELGIRYDTFGGEYENRDPGTSGFRHDMNDFDVFSPKIGFRSQILDPLDFRASYSQGFALPKGEAKYDPNINVDPVKVEQYEIGFTFTPNKHLFFDLALYILDTTNEIQENPPGSGIYQNVGKTRRKGLEATLELYPLESLEIYGNLSLIDTEILDNPDPNLEGKKVPRVPSPIFTIGVKYQFIQNLASEIKWRHVGKYYMDNYNLYTYDGYDVVDFYTSYNWKYDKNKSTEIFFSIKNLFDEHYAQSASYFRDSKNYAVAWPRTFWVGFLINY